MRYGRRMGKRGFDLPSDVTSGRTTPERSPAARDQQPTPRPTVTIKRGRIIEDLRRQKDLRIITTLNPKTDSEYSAKGRILFPHPK